MAEIKNRYVLVEDKSALRAFINDCNKAGAKWAGGADLTTESVLNKEACYNACLIGYAIHNGGVTYNTGNTDSAVKDYEDSGFIKYQPDNKPQPTSGESQRPIVAMVMEDLIKRMEKGVKDYGQALRANNGRNPLQDAYEEALDLSCYLKQAMIEAENGNNK